MMIDKWMVMRIVFWSVRFWLFVAAALLACAALALEVLR